MATYSYGMSTQRRKITTYGKASRTTQYSLLPNEPSPEKATPASRTWRAGLTKSVAGGTSQSTRPSSGKLVRPASSRPAAEMDVFDVPSDDDTAVKRPPVRVTRSVSRQPETPRPKTAIAVSKNKGALAVEETSSTQSAETIAKRKAEEVRGSSKQEAVRKRAKTAHVEAKVDLIATKVTAKKVTAAKATATKVAATMQTEASVCTSSHPNVKRPADAQTSTVDEPVKKSRRIGATPNPPPTTSKGVSAPAALARMVTKRDSPRKGTARRVAVGPPTPSTPPPASGDDILLETPIRNTSSSPKAPRSAAVTPRQKQMWEKLFDDATDGPKEWSAGPLDSAPVPAPRNLRRSQSEVAFPQKKRVRLVESLKATADVIEEEGEFSSDESAAENSPAKSNAVMDRSSVDLQDSQQLTNSQTPVFKSATTKITYGQQRTYLEDKSEDVFLNLLTQDITNDSQRLIPEDEPEEESQGQPKSVHDLRAAGSRKRLLDGLEALISEVEGQGMSSMSSRCSAMIELITKLREPDALTCFFDHGLDRSFVRSCKEPSEIALNCLAAFAFSVIIHGGANLMVLQSIQKSDWFQNALTLLPFEQDMSKLFKERRFNMSRIALSSFVELQATILGSDIWADGKPKAVSPRAIVLRTLDQLVRRMRELGSRDTIFDDKPITALLSVAESQLKKDDDPLIFELVLSILESNSLATQIPKKPSTSSIGHLTSISGILSTFFSRPRTEARRVESLSLRLCLNLTNNNPRACEIFATPALTKPLLNSINEMFASLDSSLDSQEHTKTLDQLVLTLGAMINLAEFSELARLSLVKGDCAPLDRAVRLFLASLERAEQADSMEASQTNVAYGYLAVFLGNLCQNKQVRARVRVLLPGQGLDSLISAVDEFIKINQKAAKEMLNGQEGNEVYTKYTNRLLEVVERLRWVRDS
ncbi:hypothetical protein EJ06DRAFT_546418 [Trichodelitschia bisporula]|uniref:Wings apart-like protein C-terminal domain-containing protein n=1 Tax=Trichodelitschia bisporula TaxID=703511 RepID=A0A6G1I8C7_9PEZI|nr:hypothetical protein EJ06DRAFT_546418 [Trichodelitschia bisporula]